MYFTDNLNCWPLWGDSKDAQNRPQHSHTTLAFRIDDEEKPPFKNPNSGDSIVPVITWFCYNFGVGSALRPEALFVVVTRKRRSERAVECSACRLDDFCHWSRVRSGGKKGYKSKLIHWDNLVITRISEVKSTWNSTIYKEVSTRVHWNFTITLQQHGVETILHLDYLCCMPVTVSKLFYHLFHRVLLCLRVGEPL